MSFRRTDISLSDLHAICQTIVARWIDHVRRGGSVEFSYMMYRNQLQGFLVLAAGTAGEYIVKRAQNDLDAEYRRLKGLEGNSGN
ncbi:hypothetical protein [Methylocaldum szegediense]|jgi:hypothetical protein|uniref:Uncharacterized protein n=1 Tax=Methylocaldum szegediense TaxID=73780 RepID=A0ABM9I5E1_9GAMM|nr:hypothetical protein [Methylocaldum szegediense]CAI8903069.1 conserved protein of unknown function [Methylocaldum szegediense]